MGQRAKRQKKELIAELEELSVGCSWDRLQFWRPLALARATRPHVILMDLQLKGTGDSVDAALALFEEAIGARLLIFTGVRDPEALRRIEHDHAATLLIKPANPERLSTAIEDVLRA